MGSRRGAGLALITMLLVALAASSTYARELGPGVSIRSEEPVGTGFTYQGRLSDGGSPADGAYDFEFRLFDAPEDGAQVGNSVVIDDYQVAEGLLTVELDFGQRIFTGQALYLEVGVRAGAGSGPYTVLSPRQPLTAAPYALSLPGLYTVPNSFSPNVVGGAWENALWDDLVGATIAGGGGSGMKNVITDRFCTIGGGADNVAGDESADPTDAWFATVGGGWQNRATNANATVGGGAENAAAGVSSVVGGGYLNEASGELHATIGGGVGNQASGANQATIGGGDHNVASGEWNATVAGGAQNLAGGNEATVGGGAENRAVGEYNATVGGGYANTASGSDATVGGGNANTAEGWAATISGGQTNTATASIATVGGGGYNAADGWAATVAGGDGNRATENWSTVAGGYGNEASGEDATVGGGWENVADGWATTVSGGDSNRAFGSGSTVGGGIGNTASYSATISGGKGNIASAGWSTIGGGRYNTVQQYSEGATVAGGSNNEAADDCATVSGGLSNFAGGRYSVVGGGEDNAVSDEHGTVGGGIGNTAGAWGATVGGGLGNQATGEGATVGGGGYFVGVIESYPNVASGGNSTVGGGTGNVASGLFATVPGGADNLAQGWGSFAAGRQAKAYQQGCFVWGDSTGSDVACTQEDEVVIRASGGVYLYTSGDLSSGSYLGPGMSNWNPLPPPSDRALKEHVALVDTGEVLQRLARVPISTWNYTTQDAGVRHIGPMAQDFYAAFGLGDDDRHISTIDADGVALAAIQALHEVNREQAGRVKALEMENAALREGLETLEARVSALERGGADRSSSVSLLAVGLLVAGCGVVLAGGRGQVRKLVGGGGC